MRRVGWVEPLRNPSAAVDGFRKGSTHPTRNRQPDAAMPQIEVRNVSLVYDTPGGSVEGVSDISFDIEATEFLCLLGPSGCGKTTLLNIIAGFLAPTTGEISIGGKAVSGHGMERGIVFQDFAQLFPWRTALGN